MSDGLAAPRLRRMPGIDGLRALAVAAVFLYHAEPSWLPGGFFGVDVFFVVSGYLITSLLLAELDATGTVSLPIFWMRRARRLLPALFAMLGVCLLIGTLFPSTRIDLRGDALAAIFYVANWRFVFEHSSYFAQFGRPPLLRHLWTLAVEEQFYLVWPPLFLLGTRLRRRGLVPLGVGVAALASAGLMWALYTPGTDTSRIFYGTDTRASPLLVGVVLAFVWRPSALPPLRGPFQRPALDLVSALALAGVLAMFFAVHDYDTLVYRGGFLLIGIFSAVLLATIAHPLSALGRVLATPVPRWIGERSYSIYLWHWPVLVLTRPSADAHLLRGLLIPLQAALTLVLADASYRFVETPIRHGALRRVRLRPPLNGVRAPFAVAAASILALVLLAAVTPPGSRALPPGFSASALAQSQRAKTHLVLTADRTKASTTAHARTIPRTGPILAVGDSVMIGASGALTRTIGPRLHIDAVVSRQPRDTIDRLFKYQQAHSLPQRVIVHIGDNGPVYWQDWQSLKQALAGVPLVVLVSVRVDRSWQNEVNSEMRQAVAGWRHATIADWYGASSGGGKLVDGTHTTAWGAHLLAAVINRALRTPNLGGITH